ncbi:MAG: hypothetical protein ACOCWZ_02080 [Spirochaetota bacterium]
MKNGLSLLVVPFLIICCGTTPPKTIPTGTWNYTVRVNGTEVGKAVMSNTLENNQYTYTSRITMGNPLMSHTITHIIVEKTDFTPVRLETHETTVQDGKEIQSDLVATFDEQTVTIKDENHTARVTLKENFVLDGNYFTHKLIQNNFREGFTASARVYDPNIELQQTIPVTIKVMGEEKIMEGMKPVATIHLRQSIGRVQSIDTYIDETGMAVKVIMEMMNMKMEITRDNGK